MYIGSHIVIPSWCFGFKTSHMQLRFGLKSLIANHSDFVIIKLHAVICHRIIASISILDLFTSFMGEVEFRVSAEADLYLLQYIGIISSQIVHQGDIFFEAND